MEWMKAEGAVLESTGRYLVKTNGGEWRDQDFMLMPGSVIERRLLPDYVRGRPVWVARVTDPDAA